MNASEIIQDALVKFLGVSAIDILSITYGEMSGSVHRGASIEFKVYDTRKVAFARKVLVSGWGTECEGISRVLGVAMRKVVVEPRDGWCSYTFWITEDELVDLESRLAYDTEDGTNPWRCCPICGHRDFSIKYVDVDNRTEHISRAILNCQHCGLSYQQVKVAPQCPEWDKAKELSLELLRTEWNTRIPHKES